MSLKGFDSKVTLQGISGRNASICLDRLKNEISSFIIDSVPTQIINEFLKKNSKENY